MTNLQKLGLFGFFLLLFFWKLGNTTLLAIWMDRWFLLLILGAFLYSVQLKPVSLKVLSFLCISSCLYTAFWFPRYQGEPMEIQSSLRQSSLMAGFIYLAGLTFYERAQVLFIEKGLFALVAVGQVTLLGVSVQILFGPPIYREVLFFNNPSMAGCYWVMSLFLIPLVYLRKKWQIFSFFYAWTVWIFAQMGASTPWLGLAGASLFGILSSCRAHLDLKKRKWAVAGGLLLGGVLLYSIPLRYWDSNGRAVMWGQIIRFWADQGWKVWLFGTGLGTGRVLLPMIQVVNGADAEHGVWFFWAHNDWLQIILELGLLGLSASLTFFWQLFRMEAHWTLKACLLAFLLMMSTNFLLHWPLHAVLLLFIVTAIRQGAKMEICDELRRMLQEFSENAEKAWGINEISKK